MTSSLSNTELSEEELQQVQDIMNDYRKLYDDLEKIITESTNKEAIKNEE